MGSPRRGHRELQMNLNDDVNFGGNVAGEGIKKGKKCLLIDKGIYTKTMQYNSIFL